LGVNFDSESLEKRWPNKRLLQERVGLPVDANVPLLAMVSRMDIQKGVDLVFTALKSMKSINFQAIILGTGDPKLEAAALKLQAAFPEKIKVETRYDAGLARQIYAGADMLLMPSRYEPCGLSQMIAMRYGCVPIVRAAGGLNDTVKHGETGFVFEKIHHMSLMGAIKSAIKVYDQKDKWQVIQRAGMAQDFSWQNSAKQYLALYQSLIRK
jgi:starch synthase